MRFSRFNRQPCFWLSGIGTEQSFARTRGEGLLDSEMRAKAGVAGNPHLGGEYVINGFDRLFCWVRRADRLQSGGPMEEGPRGGRYKSRQIRA